MKVQKISANFCENPVHNQREVNDLNRLLAPDRDAIQSLCNASLDVFIGNLAFNETFLCREGDSLVAIIFASRMGNQASLAMVSNAVSDCSVAIEEVTAYLLRSVAKVVAQVSGKDVEAFGSYRKVGVLEKEQLIDGSFVDTVIFERLHPSLNPNPIAAPVAINLPTYQPDEEDIEPHIEPQPRIEAGEGLKSYKGTTDEGIKESVTFHR